MKYQYSGIISADDNDLDNLIIKKNLEILKVGNVSLINSIPATVSHFQNAFKSGQLPGLLFLDIFFGKEECTPVLELLDKAGNGSMKSRVICISSTLNPAVVKKVKSFGCVADFIEKPISKEKLADAIKKYMK